MDDLRVQTICSSRQWRTLAGMKNKTYHRSRAGVFLSHSPAYRVQCLVTRQEGEPLVASPLRAAYIFNRSITSFRERDYGNFLTSAAAEQLVLTSLLVRSCMQISRELHLG